VIFDFGSVFTLTGVRVLGWYDGIVHDIVTSCCHVRESKQMMRTFIIETGESLTGPWQDVQKYRADIIGPEEPNEPGRVPLVYGVCIVHSFEGEVQDFQGFYASSRVSLK